MNKEQTLALFAKEQAEPGAWNAWANKMLARRAELEAKGEWHQNRLYWERESFADFSRQQFLADTSFNKLIFPGICNFNLSDFLKTASFSKCIFFSSVDFSQSTFRQRVWIRNVTFVNHCDFAESTFLNDVWYEEIIFAGNADFLKCKFLGCHVFKQSYCYGKIIYADVVFFGLADFRGSYFIDTSDFCRARFEKNVNIVEMQFFSDIFFFEASFEGHSWFTNIKSQGHIAFNQVGFRGDAYFMKTSFAERVSFFSAHFYRGLLLSQTDFQKEPDFIQTHFVEAPRLDDVAVPEVCGIKHFLWPLQKGIEADKGSPARFRALKRLAIQAHDHTREQDYVASELKALRGYPDVLVPCPLNALRRDDHGRRLPIWPGGVRGSVRYLIGLLYEVFSDFGRSMLLPLLWWLFATGAFVWGYLQYAGNGDKCGDSTPLRAAIGLSIRKALPFAGVASTEKLNQIYACLYGTTSIDGRSAPLIPDAVDYLGILQLLLSLILIFLFLLAVRNHFRIR